MIYVDKDMKKQLYIQIYEQMKTEILSGVIREGQILAGSRTFSRILGVSRNTVDNAYSQLVAEGYITSQRGVGYVVLKIPEFPARGNKESKKSNSMLESDHEVVTQHVEDNRSNVLYDLTNGSQTRDLFPQKLWKRYTLECLELLDQEDKIGMYQDKQGEWYLRNQLLTYLQRIRGIECKENQIIITSGLQQSLDYVCKLLSDNEKTTIFMEEPSYHKAAAVFQNNNWKIQTVPVDENGIITDVLPDTSSCAAIYTTPSHQFPTGVTLSIGRRHELLDWANKQGVFILEDDYDSEQRYYAKPIPSLQSIDGFHKVIYFGTFSKILSPSLRMGYLVLPPQLLKKYNTMFEHYNCTAPLLNQYVIGRLLETGQYDRHVRRLNHIFRKRLECFLEEFSDVNDQIKILSNGSGQYLLLEFLQKVEQQDLIDKALEHGVRVYSTMQFWQEKADCPPNTLFLGFSKIQLEQIPDCVTRLKTAWKEWLDPIIRSL